MSDRPGKITLVNLSGEARIARLRALLELCLRRHFETSISDHVEPDTLNFVFGLASRLQDGKWPRLPPGSVIFDDRPYIADYLTREKYADYVRHFAVVSATLDGGSVHRESPSATVLGFPLRHHPLLGLRLPPRAKEFDAVLIGPASLRRSQLRLRLGEAGLRVIEMSGVETKVQQERFASASVAIAVGGEACTAADPVTVATIAASGGTFIAEGQSDYPGTGVFLKPGVSAAELVETTRQLIASAGSLGPKGRVDPRASVEDPIQALTKFLTVDHTAAKTKGPATDILGLRRTVVDAAVSGSPARNLASAIDLVLHWHDRIYDVEDLFASDDFALADVPLVLLAHLHACNELPDSLRGKLEAPLVRRVQSGEARGLSEFSKALVAKALGKFGEANLYLGVVMASQNPLSAVKATVASSKLDKLPLYEATSKVANKPSAAGMDIHVAAELQWSAGQHSSAADLYRTTLARDFAGNEVAHAALVGNRLVQFGDAVTACAYGFRREGIVDEIDEQRARLPEQPVDAIAAAFERFPCYRGKAIRHDPEGVVIGNAATESPVFAGDIAIRDENFSRVGGVKSTVQAVAIIACFNEVDILEAVIRSFLEQGVNAHVIDNWSSDGTWELLNLMSASDYRIKIERFPVEGPAPVYDWKGLLARKEDVALSYRGRWVFHTDADEVRRSPWPGKSLAESLAIVDGYGCNAIDFVVLNFRPVDEGFVAGMNPETYFNYYELGNSPDLKYQIKCWKQGDERVDLVARGGHSVSFSDKRVFPFKFLCKHYPIRSLAHANRKILDERLGRFSPAERKAGWHSHYDGVEPGKCVWKWNALLRFSTVEDSALVFSLVHGL